MQCLKSYEQKTEENKQIESLISMKDVEKSNISLQEKYLHKLFKKALYYIQNYKYCCATLSEKEYLLISENYLAESNIIVHNKFILILYIQFVVVFYVNKNIFHY